MKRFLSPIALTACFVLSAGLTISANAADIAAGKAKSATCAACHGATGISPNPLWPNLAGQLEQGRYWFRQRFALGVSAGQHDIDCRLEPERHPGRAAATFSPVRG